MAVQFILGRSGTGKTSYCIKAVVNALLEPGEQQLILLVPEQATYQAERAILADERIAGYNRLNVLSFDRLQFLLLGKNTARPALSRIGRQMIVHRLLRDNKSRLKIFDTSAAWPGLSQQLAQTIAELHQYAKTPDDIDQLLSGLAKDERNNLAVLKFTDIGLIFGEYLKFIEGDFLDPDVQLTRACQAVSASTLAVGAKLWVDGFAGFTEAELAILTELLKVVADAQIAFCLDASEIDLANPAVENIDPVGLFNPTQRTYAELVDRVKKCKLQLTRPIILEEAVRFSSSPQLAHIERNIFELKPSKLDSADNIRIVSAPNARAEVRFVARQILELVREKDYRYRDIAVIASDIDSYQHYIRAYFDDYGIPFFIDKRKLLNQHPVVQLICSALQAVTGGFGHSDIFAYLKTDLVPMQRYDIDLLENYCLAFGITANDWQSDKEWNFEGKDNEDFDEQRINQIRLKAISSLLELRNALCPVGNPAEMLTAAQFTQTIFNFLDDLKVKETIGVWIEEANQNEDSAAANEHQQFYNKLIDIFDELVEVFADRNITANDYLAIINSAFSQLTLAFIPPTLDQVLVGSIERSRHPDLKAVFLIGATQRQFPVPLSSDCILTDNDRIAAESADFQLAPASSQTLAERQYFTYIAFTRPSEFLCVTYPSVDDKGGAVPRSQFIANLESLFENLHEESIAGEKIDIEKVHSESELADLLCSRLGKDAFESEANDKSRLEGLLDDICSDKQLAELGTNVLSAINYDNCARLDGDVVGDLFGRWIQTSATRLSTFAACPYRYFARYILELEERKEFKFEPLDLGNFYHSVLDALLKKLNEQKKDFATIENEELLKILNEQIEVVIQANSFLSNFSRHSSHNAYIINSAAGVLGDCVLAIGQMVRAGSFQPGLSEISFGQLRHSERKKPLALSEAEGEESRETLGKYELMFADNRVLSLDGKIDRLDIARLDDGEAAIVFDYKRKGQSFSWSKFHYGLDMQLPLYMLAVRSAGGSKIKNAVGAFYMPVEVSPQRATLDEISKKTDTFNYKARGIFNGRFFQQLDSRVSSGWSKFYSFRFTSRDEQYGNYSISAVLRPADFERVLKFTERKILQLAEEILSGEIDVRPYRLSNQSPCSYCKYSSVCRFDWQINDYNPLVSLGKAEVLEKMEKI
ncbi:MAG TPA: PD-(D/E)XK nuclease family protein [Sedimentisphaerales bacterium]|nr:PD-(D/E)XK nuclease family protein [Sedimentisphaerales bacterium]